MNDLEITYQFANFFSHSSADLKGLWEIFLFSTKRPFIVTKTKEVSGVHKLRRLKGEEGRNPKDNIDPIA